MTSFKHRPLNVRNKEIRILCIERNNNNEPIRVVIRHVRLDETLEFFALSYAWGPESPTFDIIVCDADGSQGVFPVRENLHEFLLAARRSGSRDGLTKVWASAWIWIDQICINQADHEERCHQVDQMVTLYSTAFATIVWPGTLPLVGYVDEEPLDISHPYFSGTSELTPSRGEQVEPSCLCGILLKRLRGLLELSLPVLSEKPYWTRLWIVQEIVLAQHVLMFLTHRTYDATDVMVALDEIQQSRIDVTQMRDQATSLRNKLASCYILSTIRTTQSTDTYITWPDVLQMGKGAHFKEPLDRAYAVMGLVHEDLRFKPDYKISIKQLVSKIFEKEIKFWESRCLRYLWPSLWSLVVDMGDCFDYTLYSEHLFQPLLGQVSYPEIGLHRVQQIGHILRGLGLSEPFVVPTHPRQLEVGPPFTPVELHSCAHIDERDGPLEDVAQQAYTMALEERYMLFMGLMVDDDS
ncbi:hypothetical protein SVAN01_00805 [Stagonosporopsis vannaccii]|nr:hypothetical protein SVAN01_00805 [Stagonosporopsis vannaccii]